MTGTMKRYVIEREIPGVGSMNREQLKQAAVASCSALAKLYGKAQWSIHTSRVTRPSASTWLTARNRFASMPG